MGLFGDDAWMDGDEVVDGEPPDKPRVIGGIYGGNNPDNPRYEQLLTLQKLQEEYRAEYGDADDAERLAATGKATPIGSTGFANVFGLAYYGSRVIAFTGSGQILEINPVTGTGTLLAKHNHAYYGGTVSPLIPINGCM